MNAVTRSDLIDRVAESADVSKRVAKAVVEAVFAEIESAIAGGEEIKIRGFGNFIEHTATPRRVGLHGGIVTNPRPSVKFIPSPVLRSALA